MHSFDHRNTMILDLPDFRPTPLPPPALAPGEIHLWSVDLAPEASKVAELRRLLDPEEVARVDRYRFEHLQRRGTVRRGRLRQLLGAYAAVEPQRLELAYGEKGKPRLASGSGGAAAAGLSFNLSDSQDLAVYAVTRDLELGVDVEILRPMPDADSIAKSFFAEAERAALLAVPAARKAEGFFHCWTRKEAYIKAIGEGLSEPLDRFSVTLFPAEPCHFLDIGGSCQEASAWTLIHCLPAPGSVGALAYRATPPRPTRCFHLVDEI